MTDGRVVAMPLLLPEHLSDFDDPPPNPCHPACAEYAATDYCRESWQLHLAELAQRPETHWHRCDHGRLCAIIPVVCAGRCLAAIKLACPVTATTRTDFKKRLELLSVLTTNLVLSNATFLASLARDAAAAASSTPPAPLAPSSHVEVSTTHHTVLRVLEHIEKHLADPKLNVARVARELELHPNYLSQLFSDQVGEQLHRFIRARRVELAQTLLTTTEWQIKRIATETGHANPNWFCHVFREWTGLTPGSWRSHTRQ